MFCVCLIMVKQTILKRKPRKKVKLMKDIKKNISSLGVFTLSGIILASSMTNANAVNSETEQLLPVNQVTSIAKVSDDVKPALVQKFSDVQLVDESRATEAVTKITKDKIAEQARIQAEAQAEKERLAEQARVEEEKANLERIEKERIIAEEAEAQAKAEKERLEEEARIQAEKEAEAEAQAQAEQARIKAEAEELANTVLVESESTNVSVDSPHQFDNNVAQASVEFDSNVSTYSGDSNVPATPVSPSVKSETVAPSNTAVKSTSRGSAIANAAKAQIGVNQDCTMLATNSLKAVGINFHGWPKEYLQLGQVISANEAKPGDLIYYASNGMGQSHIAVYIGNGQAIHGGWNGYTTAQFSANLPAASTPIYISMS